jgi:phage gp45-like
MQPIITSAENAAAVPSSVPAEKSLPSGRSVVVRVDGGREELEVRSPQGDVEVRITLTDAGPVVSLRGARLELESPDAVAVNCRKFEVNTQEGTELKSAGAVQIEANEMNVTTTDDIRLKGKIIHLN